MQSKERKSKGGTRKGRKIDHEWGRAQGKVQAGRTGEDTKGAGTMDKPMQN